MIHPQTIVNTDLAKFLAPFWVMDKYTSEMVEEAEFAYGSAFVALHVVLKVPIISAPFELLRNRLVLRAILRFLKLKGRPQSETDIHDAYFLTMFDLKILRDLPDTG